MKMHLTNLDELLQQVINPNPKNYLHESIISYQSGAYRSSLIATWIAVCVDIIEKIRELSASGDASAKVIEDKLNKIGPDDANSMLAFERDILKIACDDLELITQIEKTHLERLKVDRNICAHPTFSGDGTQYSPVAETALAYIVQASNYLLIHPPVRGKYVIDRLFTLIQEPSFPDDAEKAFVVLSSNNNLGKVREATIRNLIVILLKRIFKDETVINREVFVKMVYALSAISRINSNVYKEVIKSKFSTLITEANDKQLKRLFVFLTCSQYEWEYLDKASKIRVENLIKNLNVDDLIGFKLLQASEKVGELQVQLKSKISSLEPVEKSKLLISYASPIFVDEAIEHFIKAITFDAAEFRGNNIILKLTEHISSGDLERILSGSINNTGSKGYNQILNAGFAGWFLTELYDKTKNKGKNYREEWILFNKKLEQKNYTFESLREAMENDGLLEKKIVQSDTVDVMDELDIPF